MYIYEVGYSSCEESEYWQIVHEEKFSKKKFDKIIEDCLFEALLKVVKPTSEYKHNRKPSFGDVMSEVSFRKIRGSKKYKTYHWFLRALEQRGFKQVKFEQKFSVFGWGSSVVEATWRDYTDEEQEKLAARLQRRLIKERPAYTAEVKKGEYKEKRRSKALRKKFKKLEK